MCKINEKKFFDMLCKRATVSAYTVAQVEAVKMELAQIYASERLSAWVIALYEN